MFKIAIALMSNIDYIYLIPTIEISTGKCVDRDGEWIHKHLDVTILWMHLGFGIKTIRISGHVNGI